MRSYYIFTQISIKNYNKYIYSKPSKSALINYHKCYLKVALKIVKYKKIYT